VEEVVVVRAPENKARLSKRQQQWTRGSGVGNHFEVGWAKSQGAWGSGVSFASRVWRGALTEIEVGAFLEGEWKSDISQMQNSNFCGIISIKLPSADWIHWSSVEFIGCDEDVSVDVRGSGVD